MYAKKYTITFVFDIDDKGIHVSIEFFGLRKVSERDRQTDKQSGIERNTLLFSGFHVRKYSIHRDFF